MANGILMNLWFLCGFVMLVVMPRLNAKEAEREKNKKFNSVIKTFYKYKEGKEHD